MFVSEVSEMNFHFCFVFSCEKNKKKSDLGQNLGQLKIKHFHCRNSRLHIF